MQKLNEKDYARIQKTIKKYHKLGITWEPGIEEKFGKACGDIFQQFTERCLDNTDWREAYDFMSDYKKVTKFNMDSNFEITLGDSEFKYKVFNENIHREYVDAYEHIDGYKKKYNEKIGKLDKKRFVVGKKIRINYLKNKLHTLENEANLYAYWKQKDALKNDYLENKTEEYVEKRNQLNQIENIIARELVIDALKHKSILAYRDIDFVLSRECEINGSTYEVNSKNLNGVINDFRHKILDTTADNTNDLSR